MSLQSAYDHVPHGVRVAVDGFSIAVVFSTLADVLPPVAAALSIIWTTIRIFETETVRAFVQRRKDSIFNNELVRRLVKRAAEDNPDNSK